MTARRLGPWTRTECDRCGCEHQATRSAARVVAEGDELLCSECEAYDAGHRDGERCAAASLPTDVLIAELGRRTGAPR